MKNVDYNLHSDGIQLRIDVKTYTILVSDSEYFGYRSINALINDVVSSYTEAYIALIESSHRDFDNIASSYAIDDLTKQKMINDLLVLEFKKSQISSHKSKALKIHVNSKNEHDFMLLIQRTKCYENHIGFPEVIRDILTKYCKYSRAEREMLIFKPIFERLSRSLKNHHQVELYLGDRSVVVFNPYLFINPLDEEGTYILGEYMDQKADAIPLHKIKKVIESSTTSIISESTRKIYQEITSTKFNYKFYSDLASDNILDTVKMLKSLSNMLGLLNQ
jgi:hypothetical protein